MKQLTRVMLIGSVLAVAASAQWPGNRDPWRDRDDRDYRDNRDYRDDRDYRYGRGDRYGASVVDRALSNLERSRSLNYASDHDRRHAEQARRDLIRFQENWARGRFDKDRLDGAIEHLDHLADADRVHPRDRRTFARDRDALRDFRAYRGRARVRPGWGW